MERNFPMSISTQMFEIMEYLRTKMISLERFVRTRGASKVEFRGYRRKMFLTDLDDLEIRLTPLEKTVYHFFLGHPEGVLASEISEYEYEIKELYNKYSTISDFQKHNKYIGDLLSPMTNSMQEKLSKIRKKFRDVLGQGKYADYVVCKDGVDGKYKVRLDRGLIITE